jgi:hypothetical protein
VELSYRFNILTLGLVLLLLGQVSASEEPRGLLLRKGLVPWQLPLKEARTFIEENIRPNIPKLVRTQEEEGFRCERKATPGVTQCIWVCCVDLGVKDTVYFATLWFHNDRFYAYNVVFPTALFPHLFATLEKTFGRPSREEQESQINPTFMPWGFGMSNYIVNTKRWDVGNTVILLADRGGQGKPLAGYMYVAYLPLAREIPTEKKKSEVPAKLPF